MKKIFTTAFFALSGLFFLLPISAHAASYTWNCVDSASYTFSPSNFCLSPGTFSFSNNGTYYVINNPSNFLMVEGSTYYLSGEVAGSGHFAVSLGGDNAGTFPYTDINSTFSEVPFVAVSGNTPGTFDFILYDASGNICGGGTTACDFAGVVSNVCIDDNGTDCTAGGGGGGGGGGTVSTSTYNCVTANASSTDCLVQVIDYPVFDIFLGYVMFFALIVGVIWFTTLIL